MVLSVRNVKHAKHGTGVTPDFPTTSQTHILSVSESAVVGQSKSTSQTHSLSVSETSQVALPKTASDGGSIAVAGSTNVDKQTTSNVAALGVYMSSNMGPVDGYESSWPTKTNIGSFYFVWGANLNSGAQPDLYDYCSRQNYVIHIAMLTKLNNTSWVRWDDIANGVYDSNIVSQLQKINNIPLGAGTKIIVSFDNEPDNGNATAHAPNQTAAEYAAGAIHFFDLLNANCGPKIETGIHFAGGNQSFCNTVLSSGGSALHTRLENVGWDPYKKGTETTLNCTQLWAEFINGVLIPRGFDDIPRHITETGIKTDVFSNGGQYTTAQQITFYQQWPAALAANNIKSAIWFRSNSGQHNYIPTDSAVDDAFRDMVDSYLG